MKKNKIVNQNFQLQINFEDEFSIDKKASFSNSCTSLKSKETKTTVISFSQVVSHNKKVQENELRNFVLNNTKSF